MIHELKILPKYFEQVWLENKNFELRKNDRDYKVGDYIRLLEFNNGTYTVRECSRKILYILRDCSEYGLIDGFVILSYK